MTGTLVTTILTFLFGGTGVVTLFMTLNERKNNAKLTEANTNKVLQEIYGGIIKDLKTKIEGLQEEVKQLTKTINERHEMCKECPNNVKR